MMRPDLRGLPNIFLLRLPLLCFLLWCFGSYAPVIAQNAPADPASCKETLGTYQQQGFIVKKISLRPLLKFIPSTPGMEESLQAAINKLKPSQSTLQVNEPFDLRKLSLLLAEINVEIDNRILKGRTGFSYIIPRVYNCNADADPPTLEVEYLLLTAARPSYLTGSFELRGRKSENKEQAGSSQSDEGRLLPTPYVGYNRSRGVYAGTIASFKTGKAIFEKMDLDVSASHSSGVADLSLSGSREFATGPLSYAEWRLAYKYSDVPADPIRLKDGTVLGQFFGATRPVGSRNLFFRFGASVEGGNRQTNLDMNSVPKSSLAQSGYGAIKLYLGGTVSSNRQDFKSSYGLQLGNSGEGLRVNYIKQIFDTAYRLRLIPRDHKPFQADAQFTAGVLHNLNDNIPIVERFFGGNVEREFIEGDTWRIRSNPFIRSFPQNRLNRSESGLPIGGTNFVSFNLTLAQTVWNRQLLPKDIYLDPDLTGGLGGALLLTRRYFREQDIQASAHFQDLRNEVGKLTPVVNNLKSELTGMQSKLNAIQSEKIRVAILKEIDKFSNADPDSGVAPIPDTEDAIEAAVSEPDSTNIVETDNAFIARPDDSRVEINAKTLAENDPANETISLISVLRDDISSLREVLSKNGMVEIGKELPNLDAQFRDSQTRIKRDLALIDQLRAYRPEQVEQLVSKLNEPSPKSNKKLDGILEDIRKQIKPIEDNVKQELKSLPPDSKDEAVIMKREALLDFQSQLDTVDGYAIKAKAAFDSVNEYKDKKQFDEAKNSIESLTIGYGGAIPSFLSGLSDSIRNLQEPFAGRGLNSEWNSLLGGSAELLAIQSRVKSGFNSIEVPSAEQKANVTVSFTGRVLGVFFRELNVIGISPVVTFDAARLGPLQAPGQSGFRYGAGTGIRFSLVNVDFTAGYSFNLNRRPGEGRGAFTFSLSVNDLFH